MDSTCEGDGVIGVIGQGYVGLPLAVALAESGRPTLGFDRSSELAASLSQGSSHILDVTDERLQRCLDGSLRISGDPSELAECTVFVICVPTPLTEQGTPDVGFIEAAVREIAPHVRSGTLVVLESTSYPGTTEEVVAQPLAALTGLVAGLDFCVAFSPERVDPGNAEFSLENTPKIVAGLEDCCLQRATELYGGVCEGVVPSSGLREAELAKLLENTYRQVNIALMNEMVKFCGALDIDLHEAIRLAATKPFGYQPFYPGPGVGGHCIPIDPQYLAARVEDRLGHSFRFVELAQEINRGMPAYVVDRLADELTRRGSDISDARVLLMGITYKADVGDMRESPAAQVARHLRARGASLGYMDPFVPEWLVDGAAVTPVALTESTRSFDAAVYLQDHAAFAGISFTETLPLVLDTRGRLAGPTVVRL